MGNQRRHVGSSQLPLHYTQTVTEVMYIPRVYGLASFETPTVANGLCIREDAIYGISHTAWHRFILEAVENAIHHATFRG